MKRISLAAGLLAATTVAAPLSAQATVFDALCEGVECKVTIDARGFGTATHFIPSNAVAQWYTGGKGDHYKTGEGVVGSAAGTIGGALLGAAATCWTIILCPVGFFGGMAAGALGGAQAGNASDHQFTVVGYTEQGEKVSKSFRFINKKPARQVMIDLPVMTGLAMGQIRPLDKIAAALGVELSEEVPGDQKVADMPLAIGQAAVALKPKSDKVCWSRYLSKPGMRAWADANAEAAAKVQANYGDC